VELHYAHAGEGPLIVFLRGFPQCWCQYRHPLAEFSRDHLALVPNLRGHNLPSKRDDVHAHLTCTARGGHPPAGGAARRCAGFTPRARGRPPDGTLAHGNIVRHISSQTVTVPTLVTYPTADRWIRPASHAGLERHVPDLTFIEVDGAAHWLAEEHPEHVNRAIREHLTRVSTG